MFCTHKQTIDEEVVKVLAYNPRLFLDEIKKNVVSENKISLQGWYKVIKRLMIEGVVVKEKKRYSLNVAWIIDILKFSEALKATYINKTPQTIIHLPTKEKESIFFKFSDLLSMNTFWAHLLTYIASKEPQHKKLYAYNPHFWFYLAHDEIEKQYNRSMKEFDVKTYMVIGSTNFLDRWNVRFFDPQSTLTHLCSEPLFYNKKKYINYIGGFLIEITIPKEVAQSIDDIFNTVHSLSDISKLELIKLFQYKAKCMITIAKDKHNGGLFKKKIVQFFK